MTTKTFCKKTGWPYEEFRQLYISEICEIISLYDLTWVLTPLKKKKKT